MGNHHSSSYSMDTVARDIVHVYRSTSVKQGPRKVVKRKRRAPQPPIKNSMEKYTLSKDISSSSVTDSSKYTPTLLKLPSRTEVKDFQKISLADMELQCDGEKCKLVPSRAYKRKRNSASSTGSNSSYRGMASEKKNFKPISPRLLRKSSQNNKQHEKNTSLAPSVLNVNIRDDISGQSILLPAISELEYNICSYSSDSL